MRSIVALVSTLVIAITAAEANAELIGLWQFDGNANDSTLNANHGTLENGASFSSDTPNGTGQSLQLEGGEQHVLIPHADTLDILEAMTISAWVNTSNDGWDGILAKSPSDGSADNHAGNYELRIENGSRGVHLLYQNGGENDTAFHLNNDSPIPDNVWTHIAVTAEVSGEVSTYVDGALVSTHADLVRDTFGAPNTNPLYIGSRADLFTTMNGLLDDVAIFDTILTEQQIATISTGDFSAFLDVSPPSFDFDEDGDVDTDDYFILSDNLYAHLDGGVANNDGDFNRDGKVDLIDFGLFKDNFPAVVAQAQSLLVPEPSSLALMLFGCLPLLRKRRS